MSLCMVLITYLDIPHLHQFPVAAMGVASQCPTWGNILSFCHKTGSNWKIIISKHEPWCWLAQQNLEDIEKTKRIPKRKRNRKKQRERNGTRQGMGNTQKRKRGRNRLKLVTHKWGDDDELHDRTWHATIWLAQKCWLAICLKLYLLWNIVQAVEKDRTLT